MLPFILFFIPLYKADTNQSSLYKHCFLENTKRTGSKIKENTVQHGMAETEVWHFKDYLMQIFILKKIINFSFNHKCSQMCLLF